MLLLVTGFVGGLLALAVYLTVNYGRTDKWPMVIKVAFGLVVAIITVFFGGLTGLLIGAVVDTTLSGCTNILECEGGMILGALIGSVVGLGLGLWFLVWFLSQKKV